MTDPTIDDEARDLEPMYAAVYDVIRRHPPRSADDYGQAYENARIWRAVEAAYAAMAPIIERAVRAEITAELRAECRRMLSIPDDIPPFTSMLVNHPRRNGKTVAAGLENAARLIETTRLVARDRGDHG